MEELDWNYFLIKDELEFECLSTSLTSGLKGALAWSQENWGLVSAFSGQPLSALSLRVPESEGLDFQWWGPCQRLMGILVP